ncbi:hypothetical protein [Escherichia coli]
MDICSILFHGTIKVS